MVRQNQTKQNILDKEPLLRGSIMCVASVCNLLINHNSSCDRLSEKQRDTVINQMNHIITFVVIAVVALRSAIYSGTSLLVSISLIIVILTMTTTVVRAETNTTNTNTTAGRHCSDNTNCISGKSVELSSAKWKRWRRCGNP